MTDRRAVLFDLDGTLVDSVPDIARSLNLVLAEHGHDPFDRDGTAAMVGNGARVLLERAFAARGAAIAGAALDAAEARFEAVYAEDPVSATVIFPGVVAALERLAREGFALGVCTNKPEELAVEALAALGLANRFGCVVGGVPGRAKKPAAEPLLFALERLGADPSLSTMIGDAPPDAQGARNAGLRVGLVRFGYSTVPVETLGADFYLDHFDELARHLGVGVLA